MTVSAEEFLESAISLSSNPVEISARNSISRSYYSVYHQSFAVAEEYFPDPNAHFAMGEHARLRERYLCWLSFPKHKSVGYILQAMKLERQKSDYSISAVTVTQSEALAQIENAKRLVGLLGVGKAEL